MAEKKIQPKRPANEEQAAGTREADKTTKKAMHKKMHKKTHKKMHKKIH